MKTLHTFCLLAIIGCSNLTLAQNTDSIYNLCRQNSNHDTDWIKCLDLKSFELSNSNPDLGLKLAISALQSSTRIKWLHGIALAYNEIAVNYKQLGQLDSATHYYKQALSGFTKTGNIKSQSSVMTNMSLVYKSKGQYLKALEYLNKAYCIQESSKMYLPMGITLENIGSVYLELKQFDKARTYYHRARAIYISIKDSQNMARNLVNLGIIYDKYGLYDSAIANLNEALSINLKRKRLNSIQITYSNLAIVYTHIRDYDNAILTHKKAIEYSLKMNSEYSLATDYGNLGEVYLERFKDKNNQSDLSKAMQYLKMGYFMCQKIGFTPPQIEFGEKLLEALELNGGDYKLAYLIFKQKEHLKDSIFSRDNSLKIHKLEIENEMVQKDKALRISKLENKLANEDNRRQKQQNTILILALVIFGLVLILLYIIYINRNRIFKRRLHEISQFQSHQVRSPVVKILTIVEALQNYNIDQREFNKLLQMLYKSANELDKRIHEIVDKTSKS